MVSRDKVVEPTRTTIGMQLGLLVAIPLLCLAVLSYLLISSNLTQSRDARLTADVVELNVAIGNLIHRLQIERGATAGFLGSRGRDFAEALPGYRTESDRAQQNLRAVFRDSPARNLAAVAERMDEVEQRLQQIESVRANAQRLALPPPESAAYYTGTIGSLISTIAVSASYSRNPQVARANTSLDALVRAKESAGLERALTTQAFSSDQAPFELFMRITELVNRQAALFEIYRVNATPDDIARLQAILNSSETHAVEAFRSTLRERYLEDRFNVRAQDWFAASTARIDLLHGLEQTVAGSIRDLSVEHRTEGQNALTVTSSVSLLAILLTVIASVWIGRGISNPLQKLIAMAEFIDKNDDFTRHVDAAGVHEVRRTASAFNSLIDKFRHILGEARRSSEELANASHTINESSSQLNASAASQADSTSAVAAAVEEASVSISETASNAQRVSGLVENANHETREALELMEDMVKRVQALAAQVETSRASLELLESNSQEIGGIVNTIREIAEQTNLLALNAAIEAARAGEQGRGFAVVADEVRKLAERTSVSTASISRLIDGIKGGIDGTVATMKEADEHVSGSLEIVSRTEGALQQIGRNSAQVSDSVEDISLALREQDVAVQQVAANVERIASMTDSNSDASRRNYETAQRLEDLSSSLDQLVHRFKV